MAEEMRLNKKVEKAIIEMSAQMKTLNGIVAQVAKVLFGAKIKDIEDSEKKFGKIVKERRG